MAPTLMRVCTQDITREAITSGKFRSTNNWVWWYRRLLPTFIWPRKYIQLGYLPQQVYTTPPPTRRIFSDVYCMHVPICHPLCCNVYKGNLKQASNCALKLTEKDVWTPKIKVYYNYLFFSFLILFCYVTGKSRGNLGTWEQSCSRWSILFLAVMDTNGHI